MRTWEGWLYLSFVLDTYSRRIVGWSMANNLRTELVLDAVNMAIYTRRPSPGLIHHSDRGSPERRRRGLKANGPWKRGKPSRGLYQAMGTQPRRYVQSSLSPR